MSTLVCKTPLILCCEDTQELAPLSQLLAQSHDDILSCPFGKLADLIKQQPDAQVLLSWQQPCAELRQIQTLCAELSRPLLILLKHIKHIKNNNMSSLRGSVLLPYSLDIDLVAWLSHAGQVRQQYQGMQAEIDLLNEKLQQRKLIEKAKGVVMKIHQVDENTAYAAMRNSAMKTSQPMIQIAKNILTSVEQAE
ncbi:ANTAR domain-containing response regulator [Vibrio sp.]|uniref:ANTAR domain-containing response regulator n=1 Tax=Vibrio sp. TaxID=678 RepID=UPI003D0D9754